jgi:hypothetical protein
MLVHDGVPGTSAQIAFCGAHGTWFDRGQLRALADAVSELSTPLQVRTQADALPVPTTASLGRRVEQQALGPSPTSSTLASVFANAERTAKEVPWAGQKHDESMVLHCPRCGAPQEAALDFVCRYCKKPMGQSPPK